MQYDFESATKRLQEELDDPFLRVIFDDETQDYQVLKWIQTGCDQGYYSHQASYEQWDNRIITDFKRGDYRKFDLKMYMHDKQRKKEAFEKEQRAKLHEAGNELGKDLWHIEHPVIYSH